MKSIYKLLGVQWDHESLPKRYPNAVTDVTVPDWKEERTLFDLLQYERHILYSELLKIKDKESIKTIIKVLSRILRKFIFRLNCPIVR